MRLKYIYDGASYHSSFEVLQDHGFGKKKYTLWILHLRLVIYSCKKICFLNQYTNTSKKIH